MDAPNSPSTPESEEFVKTTRRRVLAAGGLATIGGLSGCLGQVARTMTNTGSAPAAFYRGDVARASSGGDDGNAALSVDGADATDIQYVPATIRGGSGLFSGEVTLEGWATTSQTKAQDYNASRSNKPRSEWWDDFEDADSDADGIDDGEELANYLDDEPTIGEQFTVCLPDARLPGDRGSLGDALTPRRVIEYLTGRIGDDGRDEFDWGEISSASIGGGDCDDSRRITKPGASADGENSRPTVCTTNLLGAGLSRPVNTGSGLVAQSISGSVVVTNLPSVSDETGSSLLALTGDGKFSEPDTLDDWGKAYEASGVETTPTFVFPIYAKPQGCPTPIPALFFVRRCTHDDQYLYTGGWLIDDAVLYENSQTLLVAEGPNEIVSVTPDDVTGDTYGDIVTRQLSRDRSRYGSAIFRGELAVDAGYLPDALQTDRGKKGLGALNVTGVGARGDGDDTDASDPTRTTVLALDAPVVHLDGAALSNDVKFKAGAELSKAVN